MLLLTLLLYTNKNIKNHFQFCYKWNENECLQCKEGYWLFNGKCFFKDLDISKEKEGKISPFFNIHPITINEIKIKLINSNNYQIQNSLARQKFRLSNEKSSKESYSGSLGPDAYFSYSDGILTIKGSGYINAYYQNPHPWKSYEKSIKTLIIMDGITGIGSFCFKDCTSLSSVTLPESLTHISIYSFDGCEGLTSFHIPSGVSEFSADSLDYCTNIQSISVDSRNNYFKIINGVVFSKDGSTIVYYPPAKTGKFYNIPDFVTTIGSQAFDQCKELTSVIIPDGVTSICIRSFYCTRLTSITIPNSVTQIGYSAFYGCFELESVEISSSLNSINELAFCSCSKLTTFNYYGNKNPHYKSNSFSGCKNLKLVNAPTSFVDSNFCGFTVNKILDPLQFSSDKFLKPPATRSPFPSRTRSYTKTPLMPPITRSPLPSQTRSYTKTPLMPPITRSPACTHLPQSTIPPESTMPPQSTVPFRTTAAPLSELFPIQAPPTRSPFPSRTRSYTKTPLMPPITRSPYPPSTIKFTITCFASPTRSQLMPPPDSTFLPRSTIPFASTKPLASTFLSDPTKTPPDSTFLPRSTIPFASTKPPASTFLPDPTKTPPDNTFLPRSTIPFASTKPLASTFIPDPTISPPEIIYLPQSTIPPESTIPPQSTMPYPTKSPSLSFPKVEFTTGTSTFSKSYPSKTTFMPSLTQNQKYSQSSEFTQIIVSAPETSNNYFQSTPNFVKNKDSEGKLSIMIIIGTCIGIAIFILISILIIYIKRHKLLLSNQKIVVYDEISDDLNFGL